MKRWRGLGWLATLGVVAITSVAFMLVSAPGSLEGALPFAEANLIPPGQSETQGEAEIYIFAALGGMVMYLASFFCSCNNPPPSA